MVKINAMLSVNCHPLTDPAIAFDSSLYYIICEATLMFVATIIHERPDITE
jgi:hypothetical protein